MIFADSIVSAHHRHIISDEHDIGAAQRLIQVTAHPLHHVVADSSTLGCILYVVYNLVTLAHGERGKVKTEPLRVQNYELHRNLPNSSQHWLIQSAISSLVIL